MFDFLWLPEKFYEGTLSPGDLRFRFGEHGMIGYSIVYLINTLFFKLTMRFDLILNFLLVFICGVISSISYYKTTKDRNIIFYIGFALIIFALFSPTQESSSGMSTQIRLGMTLAFATFFYSESIYQNKPLFLKSKAVLYILIILSYFIFGTFYTFSWIAAITFVYIVRMVYGKTKKEPLYYKEYCLEIIIMIMCIIIFFLFYKPLIIENSSNNGGSIFLGVINFFKFMIVSMGSVTLSWSAVADGHIGGNLLLLNSVIISFLTVIALFLYLVTNMWKKTLMPPIMIFYTIITFAQIYFGRAQGNIFHSYNNWYNVHTKFLLVALIWIFVFTFIENTKINIGTILINQKIIKGISISLLIFILIPGFININLYSKRAPHVKVWIEHRIPYLTGEATLTADANGYSELLHPYEKTIQGIKLLKKYNLNIFKNIEVDVGSQDNAKYNGFYGIEPNGARWITGNANITLENKTATHFSLAGYYPENWPENRFTVTINNVNSVTVDMSPGNSFNVKLDFENNLNIVYIALETEKSFIPKTEGWNEDGRELGTLIISWELSGANTINEITDDLF
jgi:hypothetical protein